MSYARDFILRLEDTDANYKLTNKAILELMENTSDEDSAHYGDDIVSLNAQNLSWVIVEWNLEVYARPKYHEKVRVATWPREVNSRYVWREFEVFCGKEKVAAASSKWMIIDLAKKTIVRFDDERVNKYEIEARAATILKTKRLKLSENLGCKRYMPLRRADMDINGHVHNLSYLDFIREEIGEEPNRFRIIYHREIKLGDKLYLVSATDGGLRQIALIDVDGVPFSIAEIAPPID